ncbi:MAG: hypothetical protein IT342_20660 [Candidatus Melainabacteria bacterium]|nr:hypothetical protein [Candidatus Melainabacteria bacterium]
MTVELTKPNTKAKGLRKDLHHTTLLITATFGGSLVLALYVLAVCALNQQHKDSNSVDRAVYLAARSLSEITTSHPSLGRVGLIDSAPPQNFSYAEKKKHPRVIGLNTLYATLRVDALIARRLRNQALIDLSLRDFKIARQLEAELTRRIFAAVEQVPAQDPGIAEPPESVARQLTGTDSEAEENNNDGKNDSILQEVSRLLSDDVKGRGPNLVDVRITLGSVEPSRLSSQTFAPQQDAGKEFVKDGMYRPGIPVPMPDGQTVTFFAYPHSTRLIDTSWFKSGSHGCAPWAVRLDAIYEKSKKKGQHEKIVKTACAAVGGEPVYPKPSAFIVNFPQGKPNRFDKLSDILNFRNWDSNGEWQQVVGTEVPGKGSLAPPIEAITGGLTPGDALAHALYDWLKQMGPLVEPGNFSQMMDQSFAQAMKSASLDPVTAQANSCLAVDSGSREYALLNQTNPDGPGQLAISQCFAIRDQKVLRDRIPPPSSLPLVVDATGKCVLAGKDKFDRELLKDFFSAVYETNLAALESLETSKQMALRAKSALKELDQKMYFERQELTSVSARMHRIRGQMAFDVENKNKATGPLKPKDSENLRQYNLAKDRLEALKQLLIDDKGQRDRYRKLNDTARLVSLNANKAGITTYDLCMHSNQILVNGLARTQSPSRGFLLGGRFVFLPQPVPIQEEEFFLAHEKRQRDAQQAPPKAVKGELNGDWTNPDMRLVAEGNDLLQTGGKTIFVEGLPLKLYWLQTRDIPGWTKVTFVIDSTGLVDSTEKRKEKASGGKAPNISLSAAGAHKPVVSAFRDYAFGNIRIPAGQMMFYCANAVKTGTEPKVSWSVAIRDLISSRSEGSMGEPVPVPDGDWRAPANGRDGECPGLAGEFQLRTPLPVTDLGQSGSYLTNPLTGQQIPQIPPLPSEML